MIRRWRRQRRTRPSRDTKAWWTERTSKAAHWSMFVPPIAIGARWSRSTQKRGTSRVRSISPFPAISATTVDSSAPTTFAPSIGRLRRERDRLLRQWCERMPLGPGHGPGRAPDAGSVHRLVLGLVTPGPAGVSGGPPLIGSQALEAIEASDVDQLLRIVDGLCKAQSWADLAELRSRCHEAVGRGKQVWGVEEHIRYRFALEAPPEHAGPIVSEGQARFALGPLAEVAASTKRWQEMEPYLENGPERMTFAAERAVRGERVALDFLELPGAHLERGAVLPGGHISQGSRRMRCRPRSRPRRRPTFPPASTRSTTCPPSRPSVTWSFLGPISRMAGVRPRRSWETSLPRFGPGREPGGARSPEPRGGPGLDGLGCGLRRGPRAKTRGGCRPAPGLVGDIGPRRPRVAGIPRGGRVRGPSLQLGVVRRRKRDDRLGSSPGDRRPRGGCGLGGVGNRLGLIPPYSRNLVEKPGHDMSPFRPNLGRRLRPPGRTPCAIRSLRWVREA